jgi:hypothetical protein
MQNGSIMRSERRRGPDVWEYRWREPGADGKRKHRRMVVGPVSQFRGRESVIRATSALRRDINMANVRSKGKPLTLSQLADHYSQRELATNSRWKNALYQVGLSRLPAQVDHPAMGQLQVDSRSRRRDRAVAAISAFVAFDLRKDS